MKILITDASLTNINGMIAIALVINAFKFNYTRKVKLACFITKRSWLYLSMSVSKKPC